jgi:hypothetical protein
MGAGEDEAGLGAMGEDPVEDPTLPRDVTMPEAARFDGRTKDFPLDSDGRYQATTSATQGVMLSLLVRELGRLRALRPGPGLQRAAEDAVRIALLRRVAAGQVEVKSVTATANNYGGVSLSVDFVDLTIDTDRTQTAKANIRG